MKTALITGANRGIGLEFVRRLKDKHYYIIGCCRDLAAAKELKRLADEVISLDVTDDEDIAVLVKKLNNRPIDLLLNNAGIMGENDVTTGNISRDNFINELNVNCVSVVKICDALLANVQRSTEKNILVISSQMGSISDNQKGGSYAYRASKAALNCTMRSFAIDVQATGVHVLLMHPGWVKTDMGGEDALIDVETSVTGMIKHAEKHFADSHAQVLARFDGNTIAW